MDRNEVITLFNDLMDIHYLLKQKRIEESQVLVKKNLKLVYNEIHEMTIEVVC